MAQTRQATQIELQINRIRAIAPPYDPLGPYDPLAPDPRPSPTSPPFTIPDPAIYINRDPVDTWLRTYRETLRASPMPHCAHCGRHPRLQQTWRPWHPSFALLCGPCRSGSVLTAHIVRDRTGRSIYAFLDDLMQLLAFGEPE